MPLLDQLNGKIDRVYIRNRIDDSIAVGVYQDRTLPVWNGAPFSGKECLVKLYIPSMKRDSKPGPWLRGNFITSNIPDAFSPLEYSDYIFFGLWVEEMERKRTVPTLNEVNRYFDPGHIGRFLYLMAGSSRSRGRYSVNSSRITSPKDTINRLIKRLPNPSRHSRTVIVETRSQMDELMGRASELDLTPVEMEPLR